MSENSSAERYDVVLLIEQALTPQDAAQVHSLHEGLDQPVTYHVLLPMEDAAARIESAMGSLTAGDLVTTPTMPMGEVDLDAVRQDCQDRAAADLATTLQQLRASGYSSFLPRPARGDTLLKLLISGKPGMAAATLCGSLAPNMAACASRLGSVWVMGAAPGWGGRRL